VIDTGLAKEAHYDTKRRMDILKELRVATSSADQRKGRAGRTAPGHCVRLYAEEELVRPSIVPEILRTSLDSIVLRLVAASFNPLQFDYLDPPDERDVHNSISLLTRLGCFREGNNESECALTNTGRLFNELPFDPRLSGFVVSGHVQHDVGRCSHHFTIYFVDVISLLRSFQPPWKP
jgi:ATP-dependent helicase HrpA